MTAANPIDFGSISKSAGSVRRVRLDWFNVVAQFWRPGEQYEVGAYVRPSVANGRSYRCTTAGQSGAKEPNRWPTTLAAEQIDGGVVWAASEAGANGVDAISAPSITIEPLTDELTADDPQVVNGRATSSRVEFQLTGGRPGRPYTVAVSVSAGGDTLVGFVTVNVTA